MYPMFLPTPPTDHYGSTPKQSFLKTRDGPDPNLAGYPPPPHPPANLKAGCIFCQIPYPVFLYDRIGIKPNIRPEVFDRIRQVAKGRISGYPVILATFTSPEITDTFTHKICTSGNTNVYLVMRIFCKNFWLDSDPNY